MSPTNARIFNGYWHLEGLDGWLIVVGLGLLTSPLFLAHTIITANLPFLTEPSHRAALSGDWALAALVTCQIAANIVFLIGLLLLNYLFFTRKRTFPLCMILYRVLRTGELLILLVAFRAASSSPEFAGSGAKFFIALLGTLIWVPYFLFSRRVKATFVR
jgi:hypothetical protein